MAFISSSFWLLAHSAIYDQEWKIFLFIWRTHILCKTISQLAIYTKMSQKNKLQDTSFRYFLHFANKQHYPFNLSLLSSDC